MTAYLCCLAAAVLLGLSLCSTADAEGPRLRRRLDEGWRFHRGDAPEAWAEAFDDSSWREVSVPHDWSIEDLPAEDDAEFDASVTPRLRSGPFDSAAIGRGAVGFTVGGVGWYRKAFTLPESLRGKRVSILFDGVYMCAEVWLNGQRLGEHPYGYTAFGFDLTPYVRFGGEANVLVVKVNTSGKTSRWYCGSGIFRHVWLTTTDTAHFAEWGVGVTTPEVSAERALVRAATTVCNDSDGGAGLALVSRIVAPDGSTVATVRSEVAVAAGASATISQEFEVPSPALWSPDSPVLYRLVSTLLCGGQMVDEVLTPFGIRSIAISAESGFALNGEPLKLRGGCVHHDNGPLGSCTYDRAEERRVEILKASGFNAIRTAHNPPSPAFLDACDRLGMLVMDEAFDCWQKAKNPKDYHRFFDAWWRQDIEAMVLRDRNHPCVFAWSIGNEVVEQADPEGVQVGAMLAAHVRALDPTRAVAIGAHPGTDPWENLDPQFGQLDVCGYNYKWERYAPDREREPRRVIVGTESFPASCFDTLMATADMPHVIGDFVWTSFDYLGEVALGHTQFEGEPSFYDTWPWTAANCGDIDICGFRRPQSYYRGAVWGVGEEVACFVQTPLPEGKTAESVFGWGWLNEWPSWTWAGHEGKPLTVRVYFSCRKVRLLLNGRDLGMQETNRATRFTATYEVPYQPGELVAVGLDGDGNEVSRWVLQTAGAPASICLTPDRSEISADGQDLSFVTVELRDAQGVLNPNADNLVRFSVEGPGSIVAVANSNPASVESFQQPQRTAWRGRCLVVIRAGKAAGTVRLIAEADGLPAAELAITVS
jgi:beta-galactosidase